MTLDNVRTNHDNKSPSLQALLSNISRRDFLKISASFSAMLALNGCGDDRHQQAESFKLVEPPRGIDDKLYLSEDYTQQLVISWGDALIAGLGDFDPHNLTATEQTHRFGFNNDYTAYIPLNGTNEGLLCVNHEYPSPELMHPIARSTKDGVDIEMAAVGHSINHIIRDNQGQWQLQKASAYNKRYHAFHDEYEVSGHASHSPRLAIEQYGNISGTLGNCAGGITPWGTILTCEENFNHFFNGNTSSIPTSEQENYHRYQVGHSKRLKWGLHDARFNLEIMPLEANRYGWVVEIDPKNPNNKAIKRTSLGRFKHECASCTLAANNQVVVYSGDDQYFEYIYKYVSDDQYIVGESSDHLLDQGVLYVAKFNGDGSLNWLPLVYGEHGLDKRNGFNSQADIMIETRRAASLAGATAMDRPEDIAIHPITGNVYVMLTKNHKRSEMQINAANPKANNNGGHIIEIITQGYDHNANQAAWRIIYMGGEMQDLANNRWLACPDNASFATDGTLWVSTDGMEKGFARGDGLFKCDIHHNRRATVQQLLQAPIGSEVTGITPMEGNNGVFVAIQHPAEGSHGFIAPTTRWPHFNNNKPPLPSVIFIEKLTT